MSEELLKPSSLDGPGAPENKAESTGRRMPPFLSWLLLLLLLAAALWGIRSLGRKAGEVTVAVPTPTASPEPTATPDPALRIKAEKAREDLLGLLGPLRATEPERWADGEWGKIQEALAEGDRLMSEQKYSEAAGIYRQQVLPGLEDLHKRLPALPAVLMPQAHGAYARGDKEEAVALLEIVLVLQSDHEGAAALLPRAKTADRSYALLRAAEGYTKTREWDLAWVELNRLQDLDSEFPGGEALRETVSEKLSESEFGKWISQAVLALEADDLTSAGELVDRALGFRPRDPFALDLQKQIEERRVQRKVLELKNEAEKLTAEEKWTESHRRWLEMKALDPEAPWIEQGLRLSLQWKLLAEKIRKGLENPGSEQSGIWVEEMRDRGGWPPRLAERAEALAEAWRLHTTPVPVTLVSDLETRVEIAGVGRWRPFLEKELDLKPGAYVAKGIRLGYRDVRVPFEVKPGQTELKVEVICVEGI